MIAFLAFVAGYRKSSITESIDELLAYFSEPESPKAQAPYVEIENPDPEVNAPPVKFNQTTAPNPYADLLKKQQEQQTAGAENSSGGYWMNSRKNPFGGTLSAIQQKEIQDRQTEQRNLYFEKLSEQMKAMRGESPTAPTARRGNLEMEDAEEAELAEPEPPQPDGEVEPPAPEKEEVELSNEPPQTVVFDPNGELEAEEERMAVEEEELIQILTEMGQ